MRVLIIEDDELLGDGITQVLTSRGFEVEWRRDARSGEEALQYLEFDSVILDLNLPDRPGMGVLQRWRKRGDTTPVLVLTARSEVHDRVFALDMGADDYLIKPFDVDELCARINALHRRNQGCFSTGMSIGGLTVNPESRTVC